MNTQERRLFVIGLLLVIGVSLFLAQSTLGTKFDRIFRDQITDTRIRNEITIVGIDDASLQTLGAWPFDRSTFAKALDVLYKKGARLVVFDVLLLEDRSGDASVRTSLLSNKKETIFASKFNGSNELLKSVYRDTMYVQSGVAHVFPDDDGKVRSIVLSQKDSFGNCHNGLAYQAFISYSKNSNQLCDTENKEFLYQDKLPKTISFGEVVRDEIHESMIRDKVVFIGSNTLDLEDHFIGRNGEKIPGVYVHASIFATLLNNSFLVPFTNAPYIFLLLIFLISALLIGLVIKNPLIQGVGIIIGALGIIILTLFLLSLHLLVSASFLLFPYVLVSLYAVMFRYSITEKKNTYIKELFGQYVHPKVLSTILKNNNLKFGGEKKYMTILFSDIRGFTTLTENMEPEELVNTLNKYLETMSPLIMEREGVIDKYIGDAIMAFWNAPISVTHHEDKAVRASLDMIEALHKMDTTTPLTIGIGLHAGDVIVGNIGSTVRINYTIIGDAVNACSRLEGLTKKYGIEIIASEQIKNAVTAHDIVWRSIDVVRVKGKKEVMKLYQPLRRTTETERILHITDNAFLHYQNKEFTIAQSLYASLEDTYSKKMIERIELVTTHTPKHWDGVWDWDEK